MEKLPISGTSVNTPEIRNKRETEEICIVISETEADTKTW